MGSSLGSRRVLHPRCLCSVILCLRQEASTVVILPLLLFSHVSVRCVRYSEAG